MVWLHSGQTATVLGREGFRGYWVLVRSRRLRFREDFSILSEHEPAQSSANVVRGPRAAPKAQADTAARGYESKPL